MLNKKGSETPISPAGEHCCSKCQRTFSTAAGHKRHAKFCHDDGGGSGHGGKEELNQVRQIPVEDPLFVPETPATANEDNQFGCVPLKNCDIDSVIGHPPKVSTLDNCEIRKLSVGDPDNNQVHGDRNGEIRVNNALSIPGSVDRICQINEMAGEDSSNITTGISRTSEIDHMPVGDPLSIPDCNRKYVNNSEKSSVCIGRNVKSNLMHSKESFTISAPVNSNSENYLIQSDKSLNVSAPLGGNGEIERVSVEEPLNIPTHADRNCDTILPSDEHTIDPLSLDKNNELPVKEPLPVPVHPDNDSLRDNMKGMMLNKVNELIDETSALGPGKCHCCGEDLDTAHLGGDFQCVDCSKSFKLKSSLERHRRVIHMEGDTYSCPECEARCPDKGTLARHMYTHTGLKPYSCVRCEKQFSRKYHLERHVIQTGCDGNPKPTHPCQVCGRLFSRKDNLREHLRAHAGQVKRKKKYSCEHCNKEFQGTTLLQIHMRTHTGEKPYQCDFCSKSFPSSGAMKKHRRKHTGERPYECKECLAKFAAKETLNRHVRTHTGVKPHVCQYCGKGFIQASQLRAHIFHHTGENGFTCEHCSKAFNRRSRLLMHVKYVHEGAKPFECPDCNKTFVRKEDLARHSILHSGVKAHKCPICQKCFAMKSSLKIHLLTHTKEPPRSCDECGRAFIRQDCLLRHMRTKHRDMLEEILAEAEKKKLQQQLLAAASGVANSSTAHTTIDPGTLSEGALADSVKELLTLLVDEATLKVFGWPDASVDQLLEAVIRRCGHQPVALQELSYTDRLRENAKLLFTVVIDDSAVKTLLNNQTVDEVILHVLRLAKS